MKVVTGLCPWVTQPVQRARRQEAHRQVSCCQHCVLDDRRPHNLQAAGPLLPLPTPAALEDRAISVLTTAQNITQRAHDCRLECRDCSSAKSAAAGSTGEAPALPHLATATAKCCSSLASRGEGARRCGGDSATLATIFGPPSGRSTASCSRQHTSRFRVLQEFNRRYLLALNLTPAQSFFAANPWLRAPMP